MGGGFSPVQIRMRGLLASLLSEYMAQLFCVSSFFLGSLATSPRVLKELKFGGQCWGSQRVWL